MILIDYVDSAPDISVNPPSHDFGDVPIGDYSIKDFVVSNNGDGILHVTGSSIVGTNADQFFIASGDGAFDLDSGNSHTISVKFVPASGGVKNAVLRIFSDDPDEPQKDMP